MKGQQEIITLIIITGILFGVIASVWLWATPIVERNKQIMILQRTEDFMKTLSNTIKFVAKNGGKAEIAADSLGDKSLIMIGEENGMSVIEVYTITDYSYYESGVEIPLQEMSCQTQEAIWGINSSSVLCVKNDKIGEEMRNKYMLKFIRLNSESSSYSIELIPSIARSSLNGKIIQIENKGAKESFSEGRKLISTEIAINIL